MTYTTVSIVDKVVIIVNQVNRTRIENSEAKSYLFSHLLILQRQTCNAVWIGYSCQQIVLGQLDMHMGINGGASLVAQTVKASASSVGDLCSIPRSEDPQEKEMATHSSILARKIPWMEEPSRLQFMGSQSRKRLSNFISLSLSRE